ncbi:unnamed protein product, partial [Brachionus calyciflorus]
MSILVLNRSDYFVKNFNYEFLTDPDVILKEFPSTRIKCLSECVKDSACFYLTFRTDICKLYNKYAIVKKIIANDSCIYTKKSNIYSDSEKLNDYFMASSESVSHNTIPSEIISSVGNQFGIKWGEWDQSDNFTTTLSTSSSTIPPVIISSINNPYGVNWGSWGPTEVCDHNDYVIGFRTKLHPYQGHGLGPSIDDTALNGVELICSNGKKIKSSEGEFGSWDTIFRNCSNQQKINGFFYGIHQKQVNGDNTATNLIRLNCTNDFRITSLEGSWSTSIISISCPYGVIVGLRTQVQSSQSTTDNTALNNIEFICKII